MWATMSDEEKKVVKVWRSESDYMYESYEDERIAAW